MQWARKQTGFTIVELLIVVVVIAILAAITIVAYNGIQNRAKAAAVQSAVSQAAKKVSAHAITNSDTYPATLTEAGMNDASGATFQYSVNNDTQPKGFCVTATQQGISYYTARSYTYTSASTQTIDTAAPTVGACPGHSAAGGSVITNLVTNPNFESNSFTGWGGRASGGVSVVSSEKRSGTYSLRVVTPGTVTDEGTNIGPGTGVSASGLGGTHRGSAWVKAPAGASMRFHVEEYTGGNTYVGGGTPNIFTATGAWQRLSATKVIAEGNKLRVIVSTSGAQVVTFYVDDVMVTAGSDAYEYADGSSSGWVWQGPLNLSPSTGPAL